jgi:hypothetical protein
MKKLLLTCGLLLATCAASMAGGNPNGANAVLVINVQFSGGSTGVTKSDLLNSAITNANMFYTSNSYGICSISSIGSGSDYVVVTVPHDKTYYNSQGYIAGSTALKDDVLTASDNAGYPRANYNIHVIAFPLCGNWYYWGYTLNGANTMINGQYSANVITHEMGHTMGLNHSGSWMSNVAGDPINSNCDKNSYGDNFDMMGMASVQYGGVGWGGGIEHFNCYQKSVLGWISNAVDYIDVPTGTHTYKVFAFDRYNSRSTSRYHGGVLALRVTKGIDPKSYWIGVRQNFDSQNSWMSNGVQVLFQKANIISDSGGNADIALIDMSPLSKTRYADQFTIDPDMKDSPLPVGSSFHDNADNVTINAVDQGISPQGVRWVDVQVTR